jgi:phytoene/squalene synthetase
MNDAPPAESHHSGAPSRASGSSFYTAMRILPRAQREAMFEIYSFCRLVDDVADSSDPHIERRLRLAEWRRHIELLYAGRPPAELRALAQAVRDFSLRKEDFLAVIDGMEMDAAEDIRAPEWVKLDLYCDRVASAVGRLSVRVFGIGEQDGLALAHHLGRALQLTNILRDIDEDAEADASICRMRSCARPVLSRASRRLFSPARAWDKSAMRLPGERLGIFRRPMRSWRAIPAAP